MHQLRDEYRDECAAGDAPCWICRGANGPIDYTAAGDAYDKPLRFHLDHFHPIATHPQLAEDPENFRPSHARCNQSRGTGTPVLELGIPSRAWT